MLTQAGHLIGGGQLSLGGAHARVHQRRRHVTEPAGYQPTGAGLSHAVWLLVLAAVCVDVVPPLQRVCRGAIWSVFMQLCRSIYENVKRNISKLAVGLLCMRQLTQHAGLEAFPHDIRQAAVLVTGIESEDNREEQWEVV